MSDSNAKKKGMRTFATDFERLKNSHSTPVVQTPSPTQRATPTAAPATPNPVVPTPVPNTPTPTTIHTKQAVKKTATAKLPAFHEIQKAIDNIEVDDTKATKEPKRRSSKNLKTTRDVAGGTIIRDTKKSSFSLMDELKKSFTGTFKKPKKKKGPVIAVTGADRRRGVIQEATTKSGTIFSADSQTLKERIKERERQTRLSTNESSQTWTPNTDTGFALLEAGIPPAATGNVAVEFKRRTNPSQLVPENTLKTEPAHEPITIETPAQKPTPAAAPTSTTPPEPVVTPPQTQEPEEQSPVIDQFDTAPIIEEPNLREQPVIESVEIPVSVSAPQSEIEPERQGISTNWLTIYVSAGLALVAVTGFFAWVIMNTQNTTESNTPPALLYIDELTVTEAFTTSELHTLRTEQLRQNIVLVNVEGERLPTALVFELTTSGLPLTVQQYATSIYFVQFDNNRPQMMVEISDPTSVIGALLTNEDALASAFEPLYGELPAGSFIDRTIASIDTRVLQGYSLTYGVINDNTLIIAATPELFADLVFLNQN